MRFQQYRRALADTLQAMDDDAVASAVEALRDVWASGARVWSLGNGGSALTAQHLITDWTKIIPQRTGLPLKGHALTDNPGLLTAYANDECFDDIFVRQLEVLCSHNDLVWAISTSGESPNVVRALEWCRKHDVRTVGLCARAPNSTERLADLVIAVPSDDTQLIEDCHLSVVHGVMRHLLTLTPPACLPTETEADPT